MGVPFTPSAEQGTPEYRESILDNMRKKIKEAEKDPKFKKHVEQLQETMEAIENATELRYFQVSQRFDGKGSLKPLIELIEFGASKIRE